MKEREEKDCIVLSEFVQTEQEKQRLSTQYIFGHICNINE